MKIRGILALALMLVCAPALAQVTPGTSPLSGAKGGTNNAFMQFTGPSTSLKSYALANASDTVALLGQIQTWTGAQSFTDGTLVLLGSGSGSSTIKAPATGGGTATLFPGSDTIAGIAATQALTNKTVNCASNTCTVRIGSDVSGLGSNVASALQNTLNASSGLVSFNGVLGTVQAGSILTNATGLPISTGISGLGTGVATSAAIAVNTASGFVTVNGVVGTPVSGVATNLTGTAAGLTAGTVTTNANLTGDVTSVGNATTLTNAPVIAKVLTGFTSGAGTVSAADSILGAFQKINGNDALKLPITSPVFTTSITGPLHIGGTGTTSNLTFIPTSGAGTTSADIIFANGNNGATERARILNNGNFGIGTNNPQSLLHINKNTTQNVAPLAGTIFQVTGADAAQAYMQIDAFGTGSNPQINMRAARGTAASSTAIQSGDLLFILDGFGYNGSTYNGSASIFATAAENFTGTAGGAGFQINTTPKTTNALAAAMYVQASGGVSVGTSTDPGIGSLQINANMFAPNLPTTTAALAAALCWTTATGQFQRDTNASGCLVSSKRYKHRIKPMKDGLAMVMASKPVTYYSNDPTIKGQQVGFIAEQMATVSEDLIGRLDDGTINSVKYMQYTAVLARAVQQLKAENDDLNHRLRRLEARFQ